MTAATELASERFFSTSMPDHVWVRERSGANAAALYDAELVVGSVPRGKTSLAKQLLVEGRPVRDVLGDRAMRVRYDGIQSVTHRAGADHLDVVYSRGTSRGSGTVTVPVDEDAEPHDLLAAIGQRLPRRPDVVDHVRNRFAHASRPFQCLVVIALLLLGARWFYTTDWDAILKPEAGGAAAANDDGFGHPYGARSGFRASRPAGRAVAIVFVAAVFVAAFLIFVGQPAVMTVLGLVGAAVLLWTLDNFLDPPRTTSLVVASAQRAG